MVDDISNDEMLDTFEEVLRLQSAHRRQAAAHARRSRRDAAVHQRRQRQGAEQVQDLVEGCSSRFNSQVLVVATGQSRAYCATQPCRSSSTDSRSPWPSRTPTSRRSSGRSCSARSPTRWPTSRPRLARCPARSTDILAAPGSRPKAADKATIVADYPLLPTRRRFWERALRAIDKAGKAGVLRTQLKIVHEAARSVADQPLGYRYRR